MDTSTSFTLLVVLIEFLGLSSVGLIALLASKYYGGFAWDGSEKQFNLHPLLMVTAFIFFYGNSVLLYKVGAGSAVTKFKWKVAHAVLHLLAFVMAVVGLFAVFRYHNAQGYPNARSLHSWLGLGTVAFYGMQILISFLVFLFPGAKEDTRAAFKTVHVFFGLFLLGMVVVCCLTGITEKTLFTPNKFNDLSTSVILTNVFGIVVVLFAGTLIYTITSPKYTRLQDERYNRLD